MTNSRKSPKKGKKATAVSRKSGPRKGDPDPTKGPPRKGRGRGKDDSKARRRRKKRTENPRSRDGKLDAEFTKVKAKELMRTAFAAVDANPPPWTPKNQHGGRSNIEPRALAKYVLVMAEECKTIRDMVAYLHAHPDVLEAVGLKRVPSKSSLNRAVRRIPQRYLRRVSETVVRAAPEPRDGVKKQRFHRQHGREHEEDRAWSSIKRGSGERHAYQKLHARSNSDLMLIEDFAVTKGTAGDSPVGAKLLMRMELGAGDSDLDSAYLTRQICNLIDERGRTPHIWPKSNTVYNANGSQAWARMVRLLEDDPAEFSRHYHARSTVESIFNAIKARYGNALRCTNRIA